MKLACQPETCRRVVRTRRLGAGLNQNLILLIMSLFSLVLMGWLALVSCRPILRARNKARLESIAPAIKALKIESFKPYKAGFGRIFCAQVVITNPSPWNIRDVEITCRMCDSTAKFTEMATGFFEANLPAYSAATNIAVSFGTVRPESVGCHPRITDLVPY